MWYTVLWRFEIPGLDQWCVANSATFWMTPYINFHFSSIWPISKGTWMAIISIHAIKHGKFEVRRWIWLRHVCCSCGVYGAHHFDAHVSNLRMEQITEKWGQCEDGWSWRQERKKDEKKSCQHSNHLRDDAQTCWCIMHVNATIDTSLQEKWILPDFCSGRERLKPWIRWQNMSPWWRRLWNFRDNRKQRFFCNLLQVGDHLLQRRQAAEAAGVPCWNIMRLSSRFFSGFTSRVFT